MNNWLIFILSILVVSFLLDTYISILNLKALKPTLPKEFENIYDSKKYALSQDYTRVTTKFSLYQSCFSTFITISFLILGGFNLVDQLARSIGFGEIWTGLVFTGILITLSFISNLPFSIYSTFVIEERFGFNRTSPSTFILDILKGAALLIIIAGPLLALILYFFMYTSSYAWLYCWIGVFFISLILQFLAPVLIMPMFNKFSPLEESLLKNMILHYANQENFKLKGIYTMDGSKRSSKLNAFFTGFGNFRKIVFYDTLIEKLENEEIFAVLAHEMGHFKLKHIVKMVFASAIQTGIMFYLLSVFLYSTGLSAAFGMENMSIYSNLVFFGFIFSPINMLVSIFFNVISRKHEFEADNYAAISTGEPGFLIEALKKLSKENLSNLTPHPLHVYFHYGHPPVLERIRALKQSKSNK